MLPIIPVIVGKEEEVSGESNCHYGDE